MGYEYVGLLKLAVDASKIDDVDYRTVWLDA